MRDFVVEYKEELVMWILACIGSSMFGIFALSHLFGVWNVLLTIFISIALLCAIVVLYQKFLAQRLYTFVLTKFADLKKKYLANKKPILNE